MGKGTRYNGEQKLNIKKVIATILIFVLIILFVWAMHKMVSESKGQKMTNIYYFTSFENNKYGVIDNKGKSIIDPSYQEYIVIPNNKKDIFLITYDVDYSNNTYKTKALNSKGKEIFTDYDQIEALSTIDDNNKITYDQKLLKVKKDNKEGLIDIEGKNVLNAEYDKIYTLKNIPSVFIVEKDGKKGIVDNTGKIIIAPQYKGIQGINEDYKNGYIVENSDGKFGVVDVNNNKVLDTKYQDIKPIVDDGKYAVKENNSWKVVDKTAQDIIVSQLKDAKDIIDMKLGSVIYSNANNKFGVIAKDGTTILNSKYDEIKFAFTDTYIIKQNGKYGIAKADDKIVVDPTYQSMSYIEKADLIKASTDGITDSIIDSNLENKISGIITEINTDKNYIKVKIDKNYKYYNFKGSELTEKDINPTNTLFLTQKDGKYGYVNKDGKTVVDPQYDDALEQNIYGYAAVQKDGKWGVLDTKGKEIIEPKLDLSQNMQIDFIDEWHLASKDINAPYYTK